MLKFLLATLTIGAAVGTASADTITLNVATSSNAGVVRAGVFNSQSAFDAQENLAGTSAIAANGNTVITFTGLTPGVYGVALFHDKNNNEELDTNLFGVPNEPFGFSRNPRIGFSAPDFSSFAFEFNGNPIVLNVSLNGG